MREQFQAISIDGQHVRVTARDRLSVEPRLLALAAALRVFERYAVLDRLTLTAGDVEVVVSREQVTRLLGPDGFAALKDRTRYRQILSQGTGAEEAPG
ncbi:MAG: hypothetical protein ACREMB_07600 [Candidatus Rokuibacteriota bacterium]